MKRRLRSVITEHKELAPHIFSLKLKTEMSAEAVPGQFIGIYPKDGARILMRPISICDSDAETGELRMVYRAAGKGTAEISGYGAGESLDILGMLGNGYDLEAVKGKKVKLVFFDGEADIDFFNAECRILEFEGSWMKAEAMTKKGRIEKLIPVSSVLSLEILEEEE